MDTSGETNRTEKENTHANTYTENTFQTNSTRRRRYLLRLELSSGLEGSQEDQNENPRKVPQNLPSRLRLSHSLTILDLYRDAKNM